MKCSKCKNELIGNKKIKNTDGGVARYTADLICMVLGGPIITCIGGLSFGSKMYKRYIKDEATIKCPHCGAELTLTNDEFKELKTAIDKIRDDERKKSQNRVER